MVYIRHGSRIYGNNDKLDKGRQLDMNVKDILNIITLFIFPVSFILALVETAVSLHKKLNSEGDK